MNTTNEKYETVYGRPIDVDNSFHQGVGNLLLELNIRPSEENCLQEYTKHLIIGSYVVAIKVLD